MRGRVAIVGVVVFVIGVISGPAGGFTFVYGEGVFKISPDVVALVVTLSAMTGLGGLLTSRYFARVFGRRWTVALGTARHGADLGSRLRRREDGLHRGLHEWGGRRGPLGAGYRGDGDRTVRALAFAPPPRAGSWWPGCSVR
jgi:hypothetical protein